MVTRLRRPRDRRPLIFVGLVVLIVAVLSLAGFYTDVLWFGEVGLTSVLWTSLTAQLATGVVVGLFVGALVFVNLFIAGRLAPVYAYFAEPQDRLDPLDRYRETLTPYVRWLRVGIAVVVALLAGLGAASSWQTFVLYLNRVSFGTTDPQFNMDIGFYFFELPFFNLVLNWLWFGLLAALLASAAAHYFYGSIRPQSGLQGLSAGVMAHLSVLLGLLALVKAAQYWIGTYELNFSSRGTVTGASYTDVNAQLPALQVLAVISVISALLFLANIRFRRIALPIAAIGIWVFFAVVVGGVWPWWVQRFSVAPQEAQREAPYIRRNIQATRVGFGLADVESRPFPVLETLGGAEIQQNQTLLSNVRVWDPDVLQRAYTQLQAITPFYAFRDVDIDRYQIDGEMRQVLLSARELSVDDLNETSRTWANTHLRYTHGFGVVASLANEATAAGQPEFLVRDLPGTVEDGASALELDQAGTYFGEEYESSEYSIVNTSQDELDYQGENDETVETNYGGEGGIELSNIMNRFAFAIRERDPNIVLSQNINTDSRIMIYKNVRDRVHRAAPFLFLDNDPYITAVDGRLKWIFDAFTTSPWYPYSERFDLSDIVTTPELASLGGTANYIRNSVKVVVDAYDGTMDFHIIDEEDPLIQAWRNTFPALFTDDEPSEELQAHFRYPEDLLRLQSEVYLTYHISDPNDFYSKSGEWAVARTETGSEETFDPTYLLIGLPGETDDEFVLTRPFTPRARNNMNAILVGRSDPEHYGELITLDFPSERTVTGPLQITTLINQTEEISRDLSLLRQRGSDVIFGSMSMIPIEESLLYVQPLFIEAAASALAAQSEGGIPELLTVVLVYGQQVIRGDTFEDALANLFDLPTVPPDGEAPTQPEAPPTEGEPGPADGRLVQVVDEASQVYEEAQSALQAGDFERYGQLIEELGTLLEEAEQLSGQGAAGSGAGGSGGSGGAGGGSGGGG